MALANCFLTFFPLTLLSRGHTQLSAYNQLPSHFSFATQKLVDTNDPKKKFLSVQDYIGTSSWEDSALERLHNNILPRHGGTAREKAGVSRPVAVGEHDSGDSFLSTPVNFWGEHERPPQHLLDEWLGLYPSSLIVCWLEIPSFRRRYTGFEISGHVPAITPASIILMLVLPCILGGAHSGGQGIYSSRRKRAERQDAMTRPQYCIF